MDSCVLLIFNDFFVLNLNYRGKYLCQKTEGKNFFRGSFVELIYESLISQSPQPGSLEEGRLGPWPGESPGVTGPEVFASLQPDNLLTFPLLSCTLFMQKTR